MPGLTPLKPADSPRLLHLFPLPSPSGLLFIISGALCLGTGLLRQEQVLILIGVITLGSCACAFLLVLLRTVLLRKSAGEISLSLSPAVVGTGGEVIIRALIGDRPPSLRPRLPFTLCRFRLPLETRDGRKLGPFIKGEQRVRAELRGAYYSRGDELFITDLLGFFRNAYRLKSEGAEGAHNPRLRVFPAAAPPLPRIPENSGGAEQRSSTHYRRTDNLIDHRPYVPGDDPRRINWKLYGHLGDLFVREGEREPPPHSRLMILLDPFCEGELFPGDEGRRALDMLCGNALALAEDYRDSGLEVSLGTVIGTHPAEWVFFKGDGEGPAEEMLSFLAFPAASPSMEIAPPPPLGERGILILALPRILRPEASGTLLDQFLQKLKVVPGNGDPSRQKTQILFLYDGEQLSEVSGECAAYYNRKGGGDIKSYAAAVTLSAESDSPSI